jgi:hypothetical protein
MISPQQRERISQQAQERCGYCQSQQKYVLGKLEIDHIRGCPKSVLLEYL